MTALPTTVAEVRSTSLLSADFIARLERLEIVSRKIHSARQRGDRRSRRRGDSAEFADYRNYVSGDDLRHIDWNIYARLDRLFLKLFFEEEELNVSILLDVSGSMSAGAPEKALYGKRVMAALAYVGLCNHDRVNLCAYTNRVVRARWGFRGRRSLPEVLSFIDALPVGGASGFVGAAREFAMRHTQKGVCVVVSDLLDKQGFTAGLPYLVGRRMDAYVVQTLSPQELAPELAGDLALVDAEDGEVAEVTISRPLLDRYMSRLEEHRAAIRAYCLRRGVSFVTTSTAQPFETLVLGYLRGRGLLR